jgi:large subunit ribosomal protein L6e
MARNSATAGGVMKHSRSKMYAKRAQHKRTKTVTKAEKKAVNPTTEKQIGGAKNGGSRKVAALREPKFYPTLSIRKKIKGHGQKPFSQHARKIRASITPGTVLILLAGVHRGKRVVFLKQLDSGLLLVTGPFKLNGVPMRRACQTAVIATSTKVDISGVAVPDNVNDAYFKRAAAAKKTEEGIFEQKDAGYTASDQRKADQKSVDAGVLAAIGGADSFLKGYLKKEFGLSRGEYPHKLKF